MEEQPAIDWSEVTTLDRFHIYKALLERYHFFVIRDLDADIAKFTGTEIVRDTQKCVSEVVALIEAKA